MIYTTVVDLWLFWSEKLKIYCIFDFLEGQGQIPTPFVFIEVNPFYNLGHELINNQNQNVEV